MSDTVATVLSFTGCEFFSNNQELMNPPEFEYLIQDLDNELNLDTEQRCSARSSLENLRDSNVDGTSDISAEDFRLSVISIIQNGNLEREQVFTELQQEIIDIHRALVLRFMRYTRWGRT